MKLILAFWLVIPYHSPVTHRTYLEACTITYTGDDGDDCVPTSESYLTYGYAQCFEDNSCLLVSQ
jgi:hypothetical protein